MSQQNESVVRSLTPASPAFKMTSLVEGARHPTLLTGFFDQLLPIQSL